MPALRLSLLWLGLCLALPSSAQTVQAVGQYHYGPDTSETTACRLAVLAAKQNALAKTVGESIDISKSYACNEAALDHPSANAICTLNQYLWSQIHGEIASLQVLKTETSATLGAKTCSATISAHIVRQSGEPPAFDFTPSLSAHTLRAGENISVTITPMRNGFLNVYSWVPDDADGGVLSKIFPNQFQPSARLNARLTIPNHDYDIVVGMSPAKTQHQMEASSLEHIVFVMSDQDLEWPQHMNYHDFSKKVFEVGSQHLRIKKQTISIVQN